MFLTDGTAVCNCPRGGNEAMQIEIADLRLWYCPTRSGVLRIEDVDGRTRPAGARTHELGGAWVGAHPSTDLGSGTPRVLSRDLRLNPPGFEPPGSDMICGVHMD